MEFELTSENFESQVLNNENTVLVDFFAVWCGPCMMMMPIIEDIADSDPEFDVGRVNVDDARDIAERYEVLTVPTLMVFKNGKPAARIAGYHSEEDIFNFVRSVK